MPRTPTSDEDDLDTPAPPVFFAEQALLGALLLEPHRLDEVPGIGPEAFSSAAHSAVFAAIRSLPAPDPAQHAQSTAWLDKVLASARRQARGLSASYLHTLVQVCPRPRHAPAYALMIEAEHARRTLRTGAQRLAQAAGDRTHPQPVPTTLAAADALTEVVDHLAATFPSGPASLPRTPTPAPAPASAHDEEAAAEEERALLATATAHPAVIDQMRWLTADDFVHPLNAGLWQAATALARRRAAVDPVTILWEAQHRGLLAPGAEPAELLQALAAPAAGDPHYWGERILHRSLLTTAHHVARHIETLTDDPATTPHQLLLGSRRALAGLNAVRARWHQATSPTPTPTPRAPKAPARPRAGPPRTTAPGSFRVSR
ncbi:DnaB-like helicase N-terminal domain-containing protein [Streptomyces sp. WZ-12]|uniref:DnaB-like helicase N-terminal domain-containing protein n=1 Tax=Streptomyces sp. WZ-12 TaxID=3030210 RepID=UPI0023813F3E|nr:DnaB-like helicase N-terminal domain-containing protein [Streptomyces sp. WZ-12]